MKGCRASPRFSGINGRMSKAREIAVAYAPSRHTNNGNQMARFAVIVVRKSRQGTCQEIAPVIVVISNRVARMEADEPIAGGLASALLPVVRNSGAVWVGSSGRVRDSSDKDSFAEIEARGPGRLEEATDVAAAAVAARFGTGPIDGQIQAHIFTAFV